MYICIPPGPRTAARPPRPRAAVRRAARPGRPPRAAASPPGRARPARSRACRPAGRRRRGPPPPGPRPSRRSARPRPPRPCRPGRSGRASHRAGRHYGAALAAPSGPRSRGTAPRPPPATATALSRITRALLLSLKKSREREGSCRPLPQPRSFRSFRASARTAARTPADAARQRSRTLGLEGAPQGLRAPVCVSVRTWDVEGIGIKDFCGEGGELVTSRLHGRP